MNYFGVFVDLFNTGILEVRNRFIKFFLVAIVPAFISLLSIQKANISEDLNFKYTKVILATENLKKNLLNTTTEYKEPFFRL